MPRVRIHPWCQAPAHKERMDSPPPHLHLPLFPLPGFPRQSTGWHPRIPPSRIPPPPPRLCNRSCVTVSRLLQPVRSALLVHFDVSSLLLILQVGAEACQNRDCLYTGRHAGLQPLYQEHRRLMSCQIHEYMPIHSGGFRDTLLSICLLFPSIQLLKIRPLTSLSF
jgi:hypothetical protein